MDRTNSRRRSSGGGRFSIGRILIALVIVGISLFTYFQRSEFNDVTGETQQVALSPDQEIALGLQAAPEMTDLYGGLYQNAEAQQFVDDVCSRLVSRSAVNGTQWPFECHLLADEDTINAFALPGGQVFLTVGLYRELETEGQLAGVMAHEIGHVVARHGAEQMAEQQLAQGISGAAVIAAYDPSDPDSGATAAQVSAMISSLVTLKYGRDDELQSDQLGVQFMSEADYDPRAMIQVMEILANAGGAAPPEFFSTHPNPENRIERIREAIAAEFPNGVPSGLEG
jgi:predicted Zn-dependent protease